MAKHTMPEMKEGGVNVTPLIDIVMCLIIFFMLVAKIGVTTGAKPMPSLVESVMGVKIEDMGNTVTLNVEKVGGAVDPTVTAYVLDKTTGASHDTELNHKELIGVLKELRLGVPTQGIKGNENLSVIIRGETDLPFSMLSPVLMACAEAGIKTVNFNTKKVQEAVKE